MQRSVQTRLLGKWFRGAGLCGVRARPIGDGSQSARSRPMSDRLQTGRRPHASPVERPAATPIISLDSGPGRPPCYPCYRPATGISEASRTSTLKAGRSGAPASPAPGGKMANAQILLPVSDFPSCHAAGAKLSFQLPTTTRARDGQSTKQLVRPNASHPKLTVTCRTGQAVPHAPPRRTLILRALTPARPRPPSAGGVFRVKIACQRQDRRRPAGHGSPAKCRRGRSQRDASALVVEPTLWIAARGYRS